MKYTEKSHTTRRSVLGALTAGFTGATVSVSQVRGQDVESTIRLEEQPIAGTRSITVYYSSMRNVSLEDFLHLRVFEAGGTEITSAPGIAQPDSNGYLILSLDRAITEDETLYFALVEPGDWDLEAARDEAFALVSSQSKSEPLVSGFDPMLIEADPSVGFEYPYLLYAPAIPEARKEGCPLLVEPNSTGTVTDDFGQHLDQAEQLIEGGFGREIADGIPAPFLVPVFPRPESDPVDRRHHVHKLDNTTMSIDDGPLERVDLQLLAMAEDAQQRLAEQEYPVREDGIMLNGFSAAGTLVDRFTVLHPEEVISVTAGGLNGMPVLPVERADDRRLPYHVGIATVEELTGEPVDLDALDETDQFLYMGPEDGTNTLPDDDAWSDEELRDLALEIYGENVISDRFVRSRDLYDRAGIDAQFRVFEHEAQMPRPAKESIIAFHQSSIADSSDSTVGQLLSPHVSVAVTPEEPTVGEEVTFTVDVALLGDNELFMLRWDFDDGETETGTDVTRTFEEPGETLVEFTAVFDGAPDEQRTITLRIDDEGPGSGEEAGSQSADDEPTDNRSEGDEGTGDRNDDETSDELSGFGIVSALSGISGLGYLAKRRLHEDHND